MIDYSRVPSPCYVLEESRLVRNLEILKRIEDCANVKIICALKGYSLWSTFPLVGKYLAGATASSLNEAKLAHEEMGKEVHVFAPAYDESEIDEILSMSHHITFNSFSQWERFRERAISKGVSPGIRVNPEFSSVETDLYNPCGKYSRLGVTQREFREDLLDGIEGLHFHALCEQDADALEAVLQSFEGRFGKWIPRMKWVNFGGGHHITRKDYDTERLIRILNGFHERHPGVEIILEPGEAVGWETGELVSSVEDIVHNGKDVAILNISVSAHMPDCLEMPYRPRVVGAGLPGEKKFEYRLGGNTCLAGDIAGDYSFDSPLKVGDRVVFFDMIHYTMVKTTFFNGVKHPDIGIWTPDGEYRPVRTFSYRQYKEML